MRLSVYFFAILSTSSLSISLAMDGANGYKPKKPQKRLSVFRRITGDDKPVGDEDGSASSVVSGAAASVTQGQLLEQWVSKSGGKDAEGQNVFAQFTSQCKKTSDQESGVTSCSCTEDVIREIRNLREGGIPEEVLARMILEPSTNNGGNADESSALYRAASGPCSSCLLPVFLEVEGIDFNHEVKGNVIQHTITLGEHLMRKEMYMKSLITYALLTRVAMPSPRKQNICERTSDPVFAKICSTIMKNVVINKCRCRKWLVEINAIKRDEKKGHLERGAAEIDPHWAIPDWLSHGVETDDARIEKFVTNRDFIRDVLLTRVPDPPNWKGMPEWMHREDFSIDDFSDDSDCEDDEPSHGDEDTPSGDDDDGGEFPFRPAGLLSVQAALTKKPHKR
eukprot:g973.t1